MSGGGHGGSPAMSDLKWVILILILLGIIWYFTGGPSRMDSHQPFVKPLAPLDTGQTYGPSNTTNGFVNPKTP